MGAAASTCAAGAVALGLVRGVQALRDRGALSAVAARKTMHTATGLVFMALWPVFTTPAARWWAAAVPAALTAKFIAVGSGALDDPKLVASATRTGDPRELLAGPALYGAVHVAATLAAWTASPAGVVALCALCAGDGLADVAGRRFGRGRLGPLPWSKRKTWAGSAACFAGSAAASLGMISYLRAAGVPLGVGSLSHAQLARGCAAAAAAAAAVESLPFQEVDNLTVPAAAALVARAALAPAAAR